MLHFSHTFFRANKHFRHAHPVSTMCTSLSPLEYSVYSIRVELPTLLAGGILHDSIRRASCVSVSHSVRVVLGLVSSMLAVVGRLRLCSSSSFETTALGATQRSSDSLPVPANDGVAKLSAASSVCSTIPSVRLCRNVLYVAICCDIFYFTFAGADVRCVLRCAPKGRAMISMGDVGRAQIRKTVSRRSCSLSLAFERFDDAVGVGRSEKIHVNSRANGFANRARVQDC